MRIFTFKRVLIFIFISYSLPAFLFFIYYQRYYKIVSELKNKYPSYEIDETGNFKFYFSSNKPRDWVSIDKISVYAIDAVLVSEDWTFYSHKGFDTKQIALALQEFLKEGKFSRGASTITQQVAKNLYLSSEKTIIRKIKELIIALSIENNLSKDKILEIYFNIAEWGLGVKGIKDASEYYFSKDPARIKLRESAYLAMLLPSPVRYSKLAENKNSKSEFVQKIISGILSKMLLARKITREEYQSAMTSRLSLETNALVQKLHDKKSETEKSRSDLVEQEASPELKEVELLENEESVEKETIYLEEYLE